VYPSTPGRGPVGDFGPFPSLIKPGMRMWSSTQEFIIVEVSALGFEEFLPKTVE
jgi:hypothetical protein